MYSISGPSGPGARRGLRSLTAALGLGLVATPLAVLAPPASAAEPVELTLLNINDFHGRIDGDTTKVATTIETLRQEAGDANTLFLSAGDNIGASLFASSNGKDVPTLDVLDALDLAASAVGNHEFDRGFDDLEGRVQDVADFAYLGANVYEKGTQTPVLDEYETFEVAGVTVGVIGTVTQQTPSLVTPTGIADLDFGDPVEATNRVAEQLTDGQEANGEADVIVAEYHEGSETGESLEKAIASSGAFASIVEDTSAAVDVIFTGHTHATYAFEAPVPGSTERTRPVLQTGSYGANVGQVQLSYDPDTDVADATVVANVPRSETEDLTLPRVKDVKEIVDAAIEAAAAVGDVPVGEITADITTAFTGGTYGPNGYTGGERDDRTAESTLGNLVANALRDTPIAAVGDRTPDIGLTNPGGLRNELYYEGATSENEQNKDGVVTFAEANNVLPFVNNIYYVDLTGATFKQILEQQWRQPAEEGDEAFLHLGLSDNVQVVLDGSRPEGQRVVSVRIDGEPLDPEATYTVSTFSFLAAGGDSFTAFTEGESFDTGAIDRDLWIDGFLGNGEPKSPSFDRRQVYASTGQVQAGRPQTVELTRLNLTSQGAPANETVVTTLVDADGAEEQLGTTPVAEDGSASVEVQVPGSAAGSVVRMVAQPSGTTVELPVVRGAVRPRLRLFKSHGPLEARESRPFVVARVHGDVRRVVLRSGGTRYVERVRDGVAVFELRPYAHPGRKRVVVRVRATASRPGVVRRTSFRVRR